MLEALACGTAVIATDCPYGPREILGDSEYGVLIRPNDPQALADAILSLLCDPERRQALAKHGRRGRAVIHSADGHCVSGRLYRAGSLLITYFENI